MTYDFLAGVAAQAELVRQLAQRSGYSGVPTVIEGRLTHVWSHWRKVEYNEPQLSEANALMQTAVRVCAQRRRTFRPTGPSWC